MSNTSVEITAGLGGFLVLFGLMVVVWFLGRDMTRRLRRMRMAEDQRLEALRRERAEQQARERQSGERRTGERRTGERRTGERRTEAVEGRPEPEPDERGAARRSSADDDPIG